MAEVSRGKNRRPKAYDWTLNVRIHSRTNAKVQAIAAYLNLEASDLVRMWLTEKTSLLWKDKQFIGWLERNKEELQKKGIAVSQLFT